MLRMSAWMREHSRLRKAEGERKNQRLSPRHGRQAFCSVGDMAGVRTSRTGEAREVEPHVRENPLDTAFFDGHQRTPIELHAPTEGAFSRWLSVEQVRKMQRMRRETVIEAMEAG